MPVKNAEPFLAECLDSIVDQTEQNWELLAVDDGSSDSSHQILEHYAHTDSRIHVLRNDGSGIIEALRKAYSNSSGDFITRMDADDKMDIRKLEALKRNLKSSGTGSIAIGQVKYFSESALGDGYLKYESWLNSLTSTGTNYSAIYKECVIPSPCWMVHREDLDKCEEFKPDTYPEDYDLAFRFYREVLKVVQCDEVLHYWRDHPNRSSRNDDNYADNRFLELKVKWFLELDYRPEKELILWGAGSKGKSISKLLLDRNISFKWVCNNPKKIGKHIYGVELNSTDHLKEESDRQIIVAVANPDEQKLIRESLEQAAFYFC